MWDEHLGQVSVTKHRMYLTKRRAPIHSHPYHGRPCQRQLERDEVARMLKDNFAEVVTTEWASLIVFAHKKDGSLRICIDYRKLNEVAVRDSDLILRMNK